MKNIKYHKRPWTRPTWTTERYGNILSDHFQGMVQQDEDGTFSGWFSNLSAPRRSAPYGSDFRIDFGSRAAAARWVNRKLRAVGIGQ